MALLSLKRCLALSRQPSQGENMSSMKFYTIPFKTSNGKTSILITQGTTQKGYVSLIHFLSNELAMKVVYANRVHKLNDVVLEVA